MAREGLSSSSKYRDNLPETRTITRHLNLQGHADRTRELAEGSNFSAQTLGSDAKLWSLLGSTHLLFFYAHSIDVNQMMPVVSMMNREAGLHGDEGRPLLAVCPDLPISSIPRFTV